MLVTDAAAAQVEKPAQPSSELIESLSAQVIERMQPKLIEIVTLEILRPVVEALVRHELEKKRSSLHFQDAVKPAASFFPARARCQPSVNLTRL